VRGCGAAVLVAVLCLGSAAPRAAQQPSAEFLKLLDQYRTGDADAAVRTLSRWAEARARRETRLSDDEQDVSLRLAAAVVLTEAGLAAGVFGKLGEDNGLEVNLGSWGIEKPFEPFSFHAYRLIEQIAKDAKRDEDSDRLALARSWFVVAASQCEYTDEHCAEGLLQRAGYLFGNDDAEYLLLEGSIRQETELNKARLDCTAASFHLCTPMPWLDPPKGPPGRITRAQLQGWWFKKALEIDPMMVEARARLGRVRSVFLNEPDAIPEFERAYADGREIGHDFGAYLAALFLGEHLENNGDLQAASVWYAKAVAVRPAYTASIALGQALVRLGKRDEGFAAGRGMFEGQGRGGDPLPDPAYLYHYGLYWQMEERMKVLRSGARGL
jgi:tetratricopeptide (TPR) repeat protein